MSIDEIRARWEGNDLHEMDDLQALLRMMAADLHRAGNIHAPEDEIARKLGEHYGYGAMMDAVARVWTEKYGTSAFAVGPCRAQVPGAIEAYENLLAAIDTLTAERDALHRHLCEMTAAHNARTAERDMVWAMARRLIDSAICDTQAEQDGFRLVAISALDAFALKAGYEGYNMESVPNVKAERDTLKARMKELEGRRCKNCANGHPHGPDIRCAYLWEILMHVEAPSSIFRADPSLVGPDDFCSLYKEAKPNA